MKATLTPKDWDAQNSKVEIRQSLRKLAIWPGCKELP